MAGRIRTIKPELLSEHVTGTLSDSAWRLFTSLYLLADDDGRLPASPAYLNGAVHWGAPRSPEAVEADLALLEDRKLIETYEVGGAQYAAIVGWRETDSLTYQVINKYRPSRLPAPSGSTPVAVPSTSSPAPFGKGKGKGKGNGKGKGKGMEGEGEDAADAAPTLPAESIQLAHRLHELIAARTPGTKIANRRPDVRERECLRWAADIEKLHRLDSIPWERISLVLEWCQRDSFWSSNILSGKKLRDKFDQLVAQMARTSGRAREDSRSGRTDAGAYDDAAYHEDLS